MRTSLKNLSGFKDCMPEEGKPIFINWATPDTHIIRSAQPYYDEDASVDTPQKFDKAAIDLLVEQGVICIVSLNVCELTAASKKALTTAGIEHLHLPVADFKAPTMGNLLIGCVTIQRAIAKPGNVLIHCGNGQGRTGTMAAAFKMYVSTSAEGPDAFISDSTIETIAQDDALKEFYAHLEEDVEFKTTRRLQPLYLEIQNFYHHNERPYQLRDAYEPIMVKLCNRALRPYQNDFFHKLSLASGSRQKYSSHTNKRAIVQVIEDVDLSAMESKHIIKLFTNIDDSIQLGNLAETNKLMDELLTLAYAYAFYIQGRVFYTNYNLTPLEDLDFPKFHDLFKSYFD